MFYEEIFCVRLWQKYFVISISHGRYCFMFGHSVSVNDRLIKAYLILDIVMNKKLMGRGSLVAGRGKLTDKMFYSTNH